MYMGTVTFQVVAGMVMSGQRYMSTDNGIQRMLVVHVIRSALLTVGILQQRLSIIDTQRCHFKIKTPPFFFFLFS